MPTFLKAINPVLKLIADNNANNIPKVSLLPWSFEKGSVSKIMPRVPTAKLIKSRLVTVSYISKKLINDIKKGLN